MKISTKSFHYRVNYLVFEYPKRNLCLYFWQTVLAFILVIPLYILAFPTKFIMPKDEQDTHSFSGTSFLGLLAWVAVILFICMISMFFIHDSRVMRVGSVGWIISIFILHSYLDEKGYFGRREKKPRKESIVISYIKAKKAKMCPLIEFTDEKN